MQLQEHAKQDCFLLLVAVLEHALGVLEPGS